MDPALVVTISTSGAGEVQVTATNTDGRPVTNVTIDVPDVPGVRVRIATATPGTAAVASPGRRADSCGLSQYLRRPFISRSSRA